jgi:hypothetical protein
MKTNTVRAEWIANELSISGCSIYRTVGFTTRADADAYVRTQGGIWQVRQAGETIYWI